VIRTVRKSYLEYLPVSADKTADLLKTEAAWAVLKEIRRSGTDGVTAEEIAKRTDQPLSTVYAALRELWRNGYIRREKRKRTQVEKRRGRPPIGSLETKKAEKRKLMGKTPREYFEACDIRAAFELDPSGEPENPWGDVIFSRSFRDIAHALDEMLAESNLLDMLGDFAVEAYEKLDSRKGKIAESMPSKEICPKCRLSHEGNELIKAIVLYVATKAVDSKRGEILKTHGLAK